jgi:hypothetical protein
VALCIVNSLGFFALALSLVMLHPKVRGKLDAWQLRRQEKEEQEKKKLGGRRAIKVLPDKGGTKKKAVVRPAAESNTGGQSEAELRQLRSWGNDN